MGIIPTTANHDVPDDDAFRFIVRRESLRSRTVAPRRDFLSHVIKPKQPAAPGMAAHSMVPCSVDFVTPPMKAIWRMPNGRMRSWKFVRWRSIDKYLGFRGAD